MNKLKSIFTYLIPILFIPAIIAIGMKIFDEKKYAFIVLIIVVFTMIPFFITFENDKRINTRKTVVLGVIIALSVAGRFLFSPLPFFKPVTAMTIICGIYLGKENGFVCGAMTALISNIYFGQGIWTPFQMFAWGMIGFLAGIIGKYLDNNKLFLSFYGLFSGVLFSLLMDLWTVLWWERGFNISRYLATVISGLPIMGIYMVSNVLFLLLLTKPIGKKLKRIKIKYGI